MTCFQGEEQVEKPSRKQWLRLGYDISACLVFVNTLLMQCLLYIHILGKSDLWEKDEVSDLGEPKG